MSKKVLDILPGFAIAIAIALVSVYLEGLLPIHLIGGSVIALFIGMALNSIFDASRFKTGLRFTSKVILKFAIILLGTSLSIGALSLSVMFFTLLTCFGGGYLVGKALGLDWKLSNLISAGTGICGGSAIAAIAPVIDAEDTDIAYAMSATFLFDMLMILAFPIMGHMLGLSDMAYGLWAGTAVNDTSSVVAASYVYSEAAGDFATMVKLTRTLVIIPTVLVFAYVNIRMKYKARATREDTLRVLNQKAEKYEVSQLDKMNLSGEAGERGTHEPEAPPQPEKAVSKVKFLSIFPWFILGFVALSIVNSLGFIPTEVSSASKELSQFLMVASLAAIGMSTHVKSMKKAGFAPMLHGFIISALVVIVAIGVEWCMGIV